MSAIDDKYAQLGGPGGWLGPPVDEGAGSAEMDTSDGRGRCRDFQNGSIYWSAATGAWEVHGDIRIKWAQLGGVAKIGFPLTDEMGTPNGAGRYNHFENGSIYWTPRFKAFFVHGRIRDKWGEMGWENSKLGFPVDRERSSDGTVYQMFEGGSIHLEADGSVDVRNRID